MPLPLIISPSILSANFQNLQSEVESVEPYADWLQVDVMDGHFVPNLSFGAPAIKNLKTKLPLDIHLMVSNPADRIDEFAKVGVKHITFHAEAVPNPGEQKHLIEIIRSKGCTAGIALNPDTSINTLDHLLLSSSTPSPPLDLVLCMTVNPGFGGQKFITDVLTKIKDLRSSHPNLMIQVDGGVDAETGKQCRDAGANNLVAGSYIFGTDDREGAIRSLRE